MDDSIVLISSLVNKSHYHYYYKPSVCFSCSYVSPISCQECPTKQPPVYSYRVCEFPIQTALHSYVRFLSNNIVQLCEIPIQTVLYSYVGIPIKQHCTVM